jgi:hypothetical protein
MHFRWRSRSSKVADDCDEVRWLYIDVTPRRPET